MQNWITYLGLTPKKRAHAEQQDQHDGTSSSKHRAGNEEKKVATRIEQLNRGLSSKTLSNQSSSSSVGTSQRTSDVRAFLLSLFVCDKTYPVCYTVCYKVVASILFHRIVWLISAWQLIKQKVLCKMHCKRVLM